MRANLFRTTIVISMGFFIVFLALGRVQLVQREQLVSHPRNRYTTAHQSKVFRGNIYDRHGKPLAIWTGNGTRHYPLGIAGSHPIGYYSKTLGTAGAEHWFSKELLGQNGVLQFKNFWQRLGGRREIGYNIQLTIDGELQKLGYELLGKRKGAVVALDPRNGELLALISSPGFESDNLLDNWDHYIEDQDEPLFNRAISGTYPPGSTFKLVVGAAALEVNPQNKDRRFYCPGYIEVEGRRLACSKPHGELDFLEGIAYSCNVVFAELGLELGEDKLREQAKAFGFDKEAQGDVPAKSSSMGSIPMSINGLAESAIGQGQILATPLQMALVAAVIANNGIMYEPHLIMAQALPEQDFMAVNNNLPRTRVMRSSTAQVLKEAMAMTVSSGTGWQAQLLGVEVAGKTGSAENPHGQAHAWFVGFAPVLSPQIVVSVVVENAGSGGGQGAPIVREMLSYFLFME